jgi:hypothetical protein
VELIYYNFPVKYVLPELISQEIISGGTFFTGTYFGSQLHVNEQFSIGE